MPAYRKKLMEVSLPLKAVNEASAREKSNNPGVINAAHAAIAGSLTSRKIELGELKKNVASFGEKKGQTHRKGPVSGQGITSWEAAVARLSPGFNPTGRGSLRYGSLPLLPGGLVAAR